MRSSSTTSIQALLLVLVALVFSSGCSVKKFAANQLSDALSGGGSVFSSDNDPELVEEAIPFSLKLMETALAATPEHEELLLALASGFAQYSYAFVQLEADRIEDEDYERADELKQRAIKLYVRARDYGKRALVARHPGFMEALREDPAEALAGMKPDDVPYLYWTGLTWAGAISLSLDNPELIGELALVEAMMERALELDPDWEHGTLQGFFITYSMSRMTSDSDPVAAATEHFRRAKELSFGMLASPYIAYAEAVAVDQQDKELFVSLLNEALAIDVDQRPDWRLANLIYQRRAKWLLTRLDWLFL